MPLTSLQAFVLGVVQGLTEFLPISSSAHLILFPRLMGWQDPGLSFDVALHLGTLAGVVVYFWKDLWGMVRNARAASRPPLLLYLIIGTVPAAAVGLLLEHHVETVFRSPVLIAWALILMGVALAAADRFSSGRKTLPDLTAPAVLAIGVAQCLALVPGVSRSGITIMAALALGFQRQDAARFSFLLAIPIIAGAGLLRLPEILRSPDPAALAAGFLGAALSGFFAIWFLLQYVQTRRYTPFVIYRWILGLFVLLRF